ncbi:hypothetical protein TCON_0244 [Astathelohania contejeani]|uniref:Uncharacterized protein n=1 Tax=Astathelohania contejeani TaxID=164912 RepID=A0ABQ7I2D9_9MICR|nr:hypothetical protein TCON_0244 [Thelohania contejeani]
MLEHEHTKRYNKVLMCIYLLLLYKYVFLKSKKMRSHLVQKVIENEKAEIFIDTRIRTDILKDYIFIYNKAMNRIFLIEVGITSQNGLQNFEMKRKKYDY